jgi:4-hydroxy-3-methylbut-2-enyl diphosphate reductase
MVDGPDDLQRAWFDNVERIGLTAGASAPEVLVKQVISRLQEWGVTAIEEQAGSRETVFFALPRELRAYQM